MKNKGLIFIAMSLILIGLGCSASKDSRAASQKSEIEGVWIGTVANQPGAVITFVLTDSEFEYSAGSQQVYRGTMILRATMSPKQADMIVKESMDSRYVGKMTLAIYELRSGGDSLVVAANEPGVDIRPRSFDRSPGSRTAIFLLKGKKDQISKTEAQSIATVQSNKDALINWTNNLAAFSYQYRIRPSSSGGGNGAYTGLILPEKMATNKNGTFTLTVIGPDEVKIKAVSKQVEGAAIETTLDGDGRLGKWTYFGKFM